MVEISYSADHEVLELRFPYDPTKVRQSLAKSIPGYRWKQGKKAWEYPPTIDAAQEIVNKFDPDVGPGFAEWIARAQRDRRAADRAVALANGDVEATGDFGFQFRTEPFAHQVRYCEWAATRSLAGLTYRANHSQQGTGKTKPEIDMIIWELTHNKLTGMPLIFCPNSVKRNWVREIHMHAPVGIFHPLEIEGTAAKKLELLRDASRLLDSTAAIPVPVINYDVLSQPSQSAVFDELIRMSEQNLFGKIIFDEATAIKNSNSSRGKNAYMLARRIPVRVTMTGTPYSKRLTDIFNQMKVLSPEILGASWPAFYRHHVIMGGWQGKEVVGYRNESALEEKVSRHSFRVLLEDCTDMPGEVHSYRYCDLSVQQVKATKKLKKDLLAQMEDEDGATWVLTASNAMTQLLRFNQITSGHLEDKAAERTTLFKPNPKMKLLGSIIKDEIPECDKGVIWCAYRFDIVKVVEALEAAGIGCTTYYGQDKKAVRDENEDKFLNDPECRFMVATASAGGKGLNWQVANWTIFYSYNFNWEDHDQAAARIRRITQRKRMNFLWLVAENPETRQASHGVSTGVNQYIIDNLAETSKMALFMTGDYQKQGLDPQTFFRQAIEVM